MRTLVNGMSRAVLVLACVLGVIAVAGAAGAGKKDGRGKVTTAADSEGSNAEKVTGEISDAAETAGQPAGGVGVLGFRGFCDLWMQKLRDRETYNIEHIAWETRDGAVTGEHVSYGRDFTCTAREQPGKDPIGKITYRETRYRRQGATTVEALAAPGTIVEQSDVTEIFRYAKGRWQY